jgi:hypothetical protein
MTARGSWPGWESNATQGLKRIILGQYKLASVGFHSLSKVELALNGLQLRFAPTPFDEVKWNIMKPMLKIARVALSKESGNTYSVILCRVTPPSSNHVYGERRGRHG